MFTGIVTAVGTITAVEHSPTGLGLTIAAPYPDLELGESIAINGACLTVADTRAGAFDVRAVATTRDRTTVAEWDVGHRVNLERALRLGDRFGGHIVQGHVDGVGDVVGVAERDDTLLLDVRVPPDVGRLTLRHGSIALDGVSLTVNALPGPDVVQVSLIPYTRDHTTLGAKTVGCRVHVEGDMIGKLVERLVTLPKDE